MKWLVTIAILFLGFPLAGQSPAHSSPEEAASLLAPYLVAAPFSVKPESFADFVHKLERKQHSKKTDREFLQHVFMRAHQVYLKRYTEHAAFANLFTDGSYNCLTGTILFSTLLDYFGVDYDIIETNYHIFIIAHTQQGDVLMEATDAREGFVTSIEKINHRITRYKTNSLQTHNASLAYYQYNFALYNTVSANELVGLLYYNLAVEAFNKQQIQEATQYLAKAGERYMSPRIEEFSELLLIAVHASEMEVIEKRKLKKSLQTIRYKALPTVATLR